MVSRVFVLSGWAIVTSLMILFAVSVWTSSGVACKNNSDKSCSIRRECKKCKICKSGADQCCCLHFDRCICSITLPSGVVKKCCAE